MICRRTLLLAFNIYYFRGADDFTCATPHASFYGDKWIRGKRIVFFLDFNGFVTAIRLAAVAFPVIRQQAILLPNSGKPDGQAFFLIQRKMGYRSAGAYTPAQYAFRQTVGIGKENPGCQRSQQVVSIE